MSAKIPLTGRHGAGQFVVVDDADCEAILAARPWRAHRGYRTLYALRDVRRADGGWTTIYLHNWLTGWPYVDHINGDGLDNQRANLRPADDRLNQANQRRRFNKTGYRGVSRDPRDGVWQASIVINWRRRHLGRFDTAEAAAKAYDVAAITVWGEYARPNFPQESS